MFDTMTILRKGQQRTMSELLATTQSALGAVDDRRVQEYNKVNSWLLAAVRLVCVECCIAEAIYAAISMPS